MAKYIKNKGELAPGILIECKSGRYLAFYEHRTDIIANGENKREAKKNLKEMYKAVLDFEQEEAEKIASIKLPSEFKTSQFTEKLNYA